ncbi:uncharacterized protein METZ01_LOCUS76349 [marine metagenome]|uniref:Carboxypeptidase regulatory-like domain-containing protein n=1 Tax=marine metagenome TaxID=408172 RepID=A0A381U5H1_9ZZZZ
MISGEGPTFSVEVSPGEVDAGAEMTLKAKASCSPAADLRGQALQIMDQDGALVESAELTEFDGESNETSEFAVKAPVEPGAYTWLAVCPALATAGSSSEETSAPFSFTVKPHSTRVVVWDVPSTIESGETFSVKLGVNCSGECRPDGWTVEVRDQDRERRATVTFGGEPWPGTSALYYAEVELSAPDTDGLHTWEARALADDLNLPHAEAVAPFGVRVVPAPECLLMVVAVDMESQTPVQGAKVVVHPYKTFTDERGVAEVRIPKGEYRLFVSGKKYFPFRSDGEIETDVTIKAELAVDRELSDADIWT